MKKTVLLAVTALCLAAQEHHHEHLDVAEAEELQRPEIALIIDMSYVKRSLKDEELTALEVPGITHQLLGESEHAAHGHAPVNAKNGFNLNYGELKFHGEPANTLDVDAIFHFSEEGVGIEEAYVTTTGLPYDLRLRAGKFRSGFGVINGQHRHAWDFADMPLVYSAFVGDHGINENGVQLQWQPLQKQEIIFGFELLQGENEQMFGTAPIEALHLASATQPNLLAGYVKGTLHTDAHTLHAGLSYAGGKSRADHLDDADEPYAFGGESSLFGADLTYTYDMNNHGYLRWQSEWLYRDMDGKSNDSLTTSDLHKKQAGYYSQLVYAFNEQWRIGTRFDAIYQNDVTQDSAIAEMPEDFKRYTIMTDYSFTPSGRIRVQYDRNSALYDENGLRQDINSFIVQLTFTLGEHPHDGH